MPENTRAFAAVAAVLFFPLATAVDAQAGRGRAPVINLSTATGISVASNYIEPSISLSEDAYVFAISVDVDRNIQVLHPDFPGLSVKMTSRRQLHLRNFFAGYGDPDRTMGMTSGRYASSSYYDSYDPGYTDSRGTVIALASRKPFNLAALTVNGDWDFSELRRLVDGRDPYAAASALARYIGERDEPIGRDVYRFAGAPRYYTSDFYDCYSYGRLGYGHPLSHWGVGWFRAAQLRAAGYVVSLIGTDGCGQPRYAVLSRSAVVKPATGRRQPATGAFPRKRVPTAVTGNPVEKQATAGRMATRPPAGYGQTERPVTSPQRTRTVEPRPGVDRTRARPAATGSFPARTRAPERVSAPPRVNVPERRPAAVAAPSRGLERTRPAPRQVERAGKRTDR